MCVGGGGGGREEKATFLKASAFLSVFGRPSFTPFFLSEAKDFGGSHFLLRK